MIIAEQWEIEHNEQKYLIELKIGAQTCGNQTVFDTKAGKSAFFVFRNVYPKKVVKINIISPK